MRSILAAAAFVATSACQDPFVAESDIAHFYVKAGEIVMQNLGSEPFYYLAADQRTLALLDWVPCIDPTRCTSVVPGRGVRRLPLASVIGYDGASTTIVVYHWRLVAGSSATAFVPDEIRQTRLDLR